VPELGYNLGVTNFVRRTGKLKQLLILLALLALLVPGLMAGEQPWASVNGQVIASGDLVKGPATIQFLDGTKVTLAKNAAVSVTNGFQPTIRVNMGSVSWDLHSKKSLSVLVAKTRYIATEKHGSISVGESGEYASDGSMSPAGTVLVVIGIAAAVGIGGCAIAGCFDQDSVSPH
jgi:hypothetical protein